MSVTSIGDKKTATYAELRPNKTVLPLVAIGGSRGKSTVSSMLNSIIAASGGSVAAWMTSGVYLDGQRLEGELRPWSRVLLAAKYGEIDVVIQELEAAVVVGAGLPARTYPLAVLTTICGNDESCRLSMSTELEERSIQAIVDAVREDGCVIANADDLSVVYAAQSSTARRIMFALHQDNPVLQRHLEAGYEAVWLVEGTLVHGDRDRFHPIVDAAAIPATLDGSFIFQVQNAMAAAAAAIHLGIETSFIADTLQTFIPGHDAQPGACNILSVNGARVVIDSPMETWTLKMLARGIKHQPHRRSLVVSSCFPNLTQDDAREVGRIIGGLGGVVILHVEGSEKHHVKAIKSGIALNPVPPLVMVLTSEAAAIERLQSTLGHGDTALVLSESPHTAIEQVLAFS